jgi:lysophospholipase L1-like esterase
VLVVVGVGLLHAPSAAVARASSTLRILVMGDSYSAGNGAGHYSGPHGCWRSRDNYAGDFSRVVERSPFHQPASVTNVACSGATTSWFFNSVSGRPPELDAVTKSYDVIFLTIGGNDLYFADMVHYCLIAKLRDGAHCRQDLDRALDLLNNGSVEQSVKRVVQAIRDRAPHTTIVLLGYPYLEGDVNYQLTDRREGSLSLTGDPCAQQQGNTKVITVGKCLKQIEDLGEAIQHQVVAATSGPTVFESTKRLFAGHELFAKKNNPRRWFVQPFVDSTIASTATWYHPNPAGWYQEARLLLQNPKVPKHPAAPRTIGISRSGRIGVLRLNVSTAADVERAWGAPQYSTTGNVTGGPNSGYPDYVLMGYRCHTQLGYPRCGVNFYVSQTTGRVESFFTTSREFELFGGVHVGMSADLASKREHRPNVAGCGQFIGVSTRQLSVQIGTRGGHEHARKNGLYVTGGKVANLGIDYKHYGVGVLFC